MATTTVDPPAGPKIVKGTHGGARPGAGREPKPETVEKRARVAAATQEEAQQSNWEWIAAIPKANWGNKLTCYAHRTAPLIDLGSGKPVAIEIISHPFDLTYILKTHGSGGYRFDFSVIPEDGSKQTRIKQFYETVFDVRYPPRIPYGTWVDDARNKDWEWAKPALLEEAAKLGQQSQQQPNSLGDLLDIQLKLKELNGGNPDTTGMAAILVQLLSNQDPAKQLEMTKTVMEMAEGKRPPADTGMSLVVEVLREQLRSVQEDLRALRSVPPPDPFGGVKPVLELLSNLGVNIGGPAGRSNPGDTLATTLGDIATKVIDKGADLAPLIVQAYQFGKQKDLEIAIHGQPTQTRGAQPWAYNPNAPAVAAPQPQPAPTPATVVNTAPLPDQPMTAQTLFLKYRGLIESIFPFLQDHFKRTNGDEFREWFIESKGTDTWAAFKKDATPELLVQLISMTPANIKAVFSPDEKVREFFEDMLDEEGAEQRESVDDNIEEGDGQDV
jgi:hypothetical protein